MKQILERLFQHEVLTCAESYSILTKIAHGEFNESQVAAFMSVYCMRKLSINELTGFRSAMLDLAKKIDLNGYDAIDIVGTGGDGKNTFNISTLSAIVVSAAGFKVIKHGNYAATSVSGASNVLEYLGYKFTNDADVLERRLFETNFCYLHAPLFHPAIKNVLNTRRNIGVRTLFNILGPIINPAMPSKYLLGVSKLGYMRLYNYLFQQERHCQYTIVHSLDGYDEISLTGPFKTVSADNEHLYAPEDLGFSAVDPKLLSGGTSLETAAKLFVGILEGKAIAEQENVVIINSAFAIHSIRPDIKLAQCIEIAEDTLLSKRALLSFKKIIS